MNQDPDVTHRTTRPEQLLGNALAHLESAETEASGTASEHATISIANALLLISSQLDATERRQAAHAAKAEALLDEMRPALERFMRPLTDADPDPGPTEEELEEERHYRRRRVLELLDRFDAGQDAAFVRVDRNRLNELSHALEFGSVQRPAITPGRCAVCGCTELAACKSAAGEACSWVTEQKTLCSSCADQLGVAEEIPLDRLVPPS